MSRTGCIRCFLPMVLLLALCPVLPAQNMKVYPEGELPQDARLQPLKDLDGYFPFEVPASTSEWKVRKERLRKQVLLATGLWP